MKEHTNVCSICGGPNEPWPGGHGYGNNAWPVAKGRCCNVCNYARVIPTRCAMVRSLTPKHKIERS